MELAFVFVDTLCVVVLVYDFFVFLCNVAITLAGLVLIDGNPHKYLLWTVAHSCMLIWRSYPYASEPLLVVEVVYHYR
jgi:hypothetical protein